MSTTPTTATLQQRTVETIKQAHALLAQQAAALETVSKTAQAYADDDTHAKPELEALIEKLSTTRVDGAFLVPPNLKDKFLKNASTKHGMVYMANQLADMLIAKEGTSKSASTLGEPADAQESQAISKEAIAARGFGALPSRNIRM